MIDDFFTKQTTAESTKADEQMVYDKNENDANKYYSDQETFSSDHSEYVPDSDEFGSDSENDTCNIKMSAFNSESNDSEKFVPIDHSKKNSKSNPHKLKFCETDTHSLNSNLKFTASQEIKTALESPQSFFCDIMQ